MTDFNMEIGEREGLYVAGLQPPVSPEDRLLLADQLDPVIISGAAETGRYFSKITVNNSRSYSELGQPQASEIPIGAVAQGIAKILRDAGHQVYIDTEIKHLAGGAGLFESLR